MSSMELGEDGRPIHDWILLYSDEGEPYYSSEKLQGTCWDKPPEVVAEEEWLSQNYVPDAEEENEWEHDFFGFDANLGFGGSEAARGSRIGGMTSAPTSPSHAGADDMHAPMPEPTPAPAPVPVEPEKELTPEEKKAVKRSKIVGEIVQTEKNYVNQLRALDKLYIVPLTSEAPGQAATNNIIKPKHAHTLFYNIRSIQEANAGLARDLELRADSTPQCIASAFVDFSPNFVHYKQYIANHAKATSAFKKLYSKSPAFHDFCEKASDNPLTMGLDLPSLLITPIQRVPRYKLLLVEVLKFTEPDHPDKEALEQALDVISQAAVQINEAVREMEQQEILHSMQEEEFDGKTKLVKDGRVFIRKGVLTRVCRSADKPFSFFLFSDMIMYASNAKTKMSFNKYTIHHEIPINATFKCELKDNRKPLPTFGWKIMSPVKSFVVFAKDQKEFSTWIKDIQKCVDVFEKSVKSEKDGGVKFKPIWMADKDSMTCSRCKKKWSLLNRRHHCRRCGELTCNECSKARMVIEGGDDSGEKVRVCRKCETELRGFIDDDSDAHRASTSSSSEHDDGRPPHLQHTDGDDTAPSPADSPTDGESNREHNEKTIARFKALAEKKKRQIASGASADTGSLKTRRAYMKDSLSRHASQVLSKKNTLPKDFHLHSHMGTDVGVHKDGGIFADGAGGDPDSGEGEGHHRMSHSRSPSSPTSSSSGKPPELPPKRKQPNRPVPPPPGAAAGAGAGAGSASPIPHSDSAGDLAGLAAPSTPGKKNGTLRRAPSRKVPLPMEVAALTQSVDDIKIRDRPPTITPEPDYELDLEHIGKPTHPAVAAAAANAAPLRAQSAPRQPPPRTQPPPSSMPAPAPVSLPVAAPVSASSASSSTSATASSASSSSDRAHSAKSSRLLATAAPASHKRSHSPNVRHIPPVVKSNHPPPESPKRPKTPPKSSSSSSSLPSVISSATIPPPQRAPPPSFATGAGGGGGGGGVKARVAAMGTSGAPAPAPVSSTPPAFDASKRSAAPAVSYAAAAAAPAAEAKKPAAPQRQAPSAPKAKMPDMNDKAAITAYFQNLTKAKAVSAVPLVNSAQLQRSDSVSSVASVASISSSASQDVRNASASVVSVAGGGKPALKFCPKCGRKNEEKGRFCSACGFNISSY